MSNPQPDVVGSRALGVVSLTRITPPSVAVALQRAGAQEARVRVRGKYEPSTIIARPGRPLRITFRREEIAACSEQVIFPAFGKSATLPPYKDVTLEVHPETPGQYEFTCRMGVLRGRIVVRGEHEGIV